MIYRIHSKPLFYLILLECWVSTDLQPRDQQKRLHVEVATFFPPTHSSPVLSDEVVDRAARAVPLVKHDVLVVLEASIGTELVATVSVCHVSTCALKEVNVKFGNLPNMSKVGLALSIGVDKPGETDASGERASLGLALPGEEEVLGHDASVVVGGEAVALCIVGAEL